MTRFILSLALCISLCANFLGSVHGDDATLWRKIDSKASQGYPALVHVPSGDAPSEGWPLVLSLHGFSLRGSDLSKVRSYGLPKIIDDHRGGIGESMAKAIVIAPQMPRLNLSWKHDKLDNLLRHVCGKYPINLRRIYGTGVSLGAAGLWNFAANQRGWFAAMVVVAGTGSDKDVKLTLEVPVMAVHGRHDKTVSYAKQVAALRTHKQWGGRNTLIPLEAGHGAFEHEVFIQHKALDWMMTHQRRENELPPKRMKDTPALLSGLAREATLKDSVKEATVAPLKHAKAPGLPDMKEITNWMKTITATPNRRPGTAHGKAAEETLIKLYTEIGFDAVQTQALPVQAWEPTQSGDVGYLKVVKSDARLEGFPVMYTPFTGEKGLSGRLLLYEKGKRYSTDDVKGRIVVIPSLIDHTSSYQSMLYGTGDMAARSGEFEHVGYPSNYLANFIDNGFLKKRDAVAKMTESEAAGFVMLLQGTAPEVASLNWPYDGILESMPGLYVSSEKAARLTALAKSEAQVNLVTRGNTYDSEMRNICVQLGQGERVILVTSHHDAVSQGVVEDASGVAAVLALAKAWKQAPKALTKDWRIVFHLAAGHFARGQGAYHFATQHPALMKRVEAVLCLEHLGAKSVTVGKSGYVLNGIQPSTVYVSQHPEIVRLTVQALRAFPAPQTMVKRPLLGLLLTDAGGYVAFAKESNIFGKEGLRYISWISAPRYLVNEHDTWDKFDADTFYTQLKAANLMLKGMMTLY